MKKSLYLKLIAWKFPMGNAMLILMLLFTFFSFTDVVYSQTITVTGIENNINISKVNLSVGSTVLEQDSPTGNDNPMPVDGPVLIKSVLLENGEELFVTTRKPEITNLHPLIGTDQISEFNIEIINSSGISVGHRSLDFLPDLIEVVSTPDLRSYWSIGSQPSIPSGESFADLLYPFPSSGYIMFSERNGNSAVDFIALGVDGKPIPGATKVQIRGYQWNTGVNHPIDNPSQKQWLVVFSPTLFNTLLPVNGVRIISINEPDGKLVFFVGNLSASPDYAGPISNQNESKAVLDVFENDELNEGGVQPFDVNLSVITPFPENTLVFNADGTVDVPANTPPGTYTMTYQITELVGGKSDQATVTVRVHELMPEANDDNVTFLIGNGDAVVNVLENDLLNGMQATLENVTLSEISNTTNGVLTLNSNGNVEISTGAQPGVYQISYQICDKNASSKCDVAFVIVYLEVSQLLAEDDDFGTYLQNGFVGNVLLNDKLNGIPLGPNQVDILFTDYGGLTDLIVENNGMLRLPVEVAPGNYVLEYELSQTLNPANKDLAEVRFTVEPNSISAINDFETTNQNRPVDIAVLDNDTSDSGTFDPGSLNITIPAENGSVTVNDDGTITYSPASNFSGEDTFTYRVCDGQDTGACDIALVTVTVRPILMELLKTVDKQNVVVGEVITYTITLTNNSQFEVEDILLEDPLPENQLYVSSSPAPSGDNTWSILRLAPQEMIAMTIQAMAVSPGEAINTVTVHVGDYQISDDAEAVTVSSQVDLKVTKSSQDAEIFQGTDFNYEIQVINSGSTDASNVVITDNLPPGLTYVSSTSTGSTNGIEASSTVNGNNIIWSIPLLPAGENLVINLIVRADQLGSKINNVEVTTSEHEELTPADNVDQDVNEVLGFFIPNVFSPGAKDNKNDRFEIKGIERFSTNKLVIFNRWGDHVYETENYQNNWAAEGLSPGSYFYVLKVTDSSGTKQSFQGWVQVIKD